MDGFLKGNWNKVNLTYSYIFCSGLLQIIIHSCTCECILNSLHDSGCQFVLYMLLGFLVVKEPAVMDVCAVLN